MSEPIHVESFNWELVLNWSTDGRTIFQEAGARAHATAPEGFPVAYRITSVRPKASGLYVTIRGLPGEEANA